VLWRCGKCDVWSEQEKSCLLLGAQRTVTVVFSSNEEIKVWDLHWFMCDTREELISRVTQTA
jgi:hypothetical protein